MIAHVDVSTGASGDKLVCALMQACEKTGAFDRERFAELFARLLPEARVEFSERTDHGLLGLGVEVSSPDGEGGSSGQGEDTPSGGSPVHLHAHVPHRSWRSIRSSIEDWRDGGDIAAGAADRALRAFQIVAEAEAQVHGMPVDDVAFHEVGAVDSIVDIVGASVLLDALRISELHSSTVCMGFGTVDCAHGMLPVPAPATAVICQDMPIEAGAYKGEMTTPTGAALLKANVTHWSPAPAMIPRAIGVGMGTRELEGTANSLRIVVGEPVSRVLPGELLRESCGSPEVLGGAGTATQDGNGETVEDVAAQTGSMAIEGCVLLQTNIDHLNPEDAASCCEDLLDAGALDVWQQPIAMKKNRLGTLLSVLAKPEDADRLCELAARLTGSLGIRRSVVERSVAPRESEAIGTPYGEVRYKVAWPDEPARRMHWTRPEHDDVARIARETGRGFAEVEEELHHIWEERHAR